MLGMKAAFCWSAMSLRYRQSVCFMLSVHTTGAVWGLGACMAWLHGYVIAVFRSFWKGACDAFISRLAHWLQKSACIVSCFMIMTVDQAWACMLHYDYITHKIYASLQRSFQLACTFQLLDTATCPTDPEKRHTSKCEQVHLKSVQAVKYRCFAKTFSCGPSPTHRTKPSVAGARVPV